MAIVETSRGIEYGEIVVGLSLFRKRTLYPLKEGNQAGSRKTLKSKGK